MKFFVLFLLSQGEDDFSRWLLFSAFVQDFDSELSLKAELELKKRSEAINRIEGAIPL